MKEHGRKQEIKYTIKTTLNWLGWSQNPNGA
jgi:hypothetical protein